MARKDRSDMKVGTFEKKHGVPPGTVRNDDGRDTRSDKKNRDNQERKEHVVPQPVPKVSNDIFNNSFYKSFHESSLCIWRIYN